MQRSQRLERMAQHELELSQLAYNGSFHALPHLEQLEVCSISQPGDLYSAHLDGRDNELKAIRKQMDSGVRPIFLYDQKNAMQRPT